MGSPDHPFTPSHSVDSTALMFFDNMSGYTNCGSGSHSPKPFYSICSVMCSGHECKHCSTRHSTCVLMSYHPLPCVTLMVSRRHRPCILHDGCIKLLFLLPSLSLYTLRCTHQAVISTTISVPAYFKSSRCSH